MANVKFKRGTQSAINKYLFDYTGSDAALAEEGCFYLTSEAEDSSTVSTNRLYIGKQTSRGVKAVPVNQGAIPVKNALNLPEPAAAIPGQFYYIIDGNILAICTNGQWVQINTNVNDDHFIDGREMTVSNTNNVAVIQDVLFNTNNRQISSTYEFSGADGLTASATPVYVPTTIGHKVLSGEHFYTTADNGQTYTLASPSPAAGYSVSANDGYYTLRGYRIVFTPAPYTLGTSFNTTDNTATVSLTDNSGVSSHNSNVVIKGGDNVTVTQGQSSSIIEISSDNAKLSSVSTGTGNGGKDNAGNTATSSTNGFNITVADTSGVSRTASFDPLITIGSSGNSSPVHFQNGTATLDVYTTSEVDAKIRDFNAMEYIGTLTQAEYNALNSSSSSTEVHKGYVWMAAEDISYTEDNQTKTIYAGDLLIANGTEVNGVIPNTSIDWEYVTGGNTYDTKTVYTHQTHGFSIGNSTPGGSSSIGQFQIDVGAANLSIADNDEGTVANGLQIKKVTITHNLTNATTTANTSGQDQNGASIIQAARDTLNIPVPVVTYDTAGHITGITTYQYTVTDTHATVNNHTLAVSAASTSGDTSQVTITDVFQVDGANVSASMNASSETIKLTNNSGALSIELVWGSF